MKDLIKKNINILLIVAILFFSGLLYLISRLITDDSNQMIVLVDGQEYGTYYLNDPQEIRIETEYGYNLLVIQDGQAYVSEADCDNQVCVHTQPVRESGGQIICLPHRVVIRLSTTEKSEIDAVTN